MSFFHHVAAKALTLFRIVYQSFLPLCLGIPTYGFEINIPAEVFETLKSEGIIIDKIAPLVLKERYLKGNKHVGTKNVYENSLKTLGEDRILSKDALEASIKEGVEKGLFGVGEIKNGKEIPVYWKKEPTVGFGESEILIDKSICERELEKTPETLEEGHIKTETLYDEKERKESISRLELPLMKIPKGKVSQILGLLNYLQSKFDSIEIKIVAEEGAIEKEDYENKIKEALRQLGSEIK